MISSVAAASWSPATSPSWTAWAWTSEIAGQRLFYPPHVAGWSEERWLDTSTFRGRWIAANYAARKYALDPGAASGTLPLDARNLLSRALDCWANPGLKQDTRTALLGFANLALDDADQNWKKAQYPVLVLNALRMLVAISPDYQTC